MEKVKTIRIALKQIGFLASGVILTENSRVCKSPAYCATSRLLKIKYATMNSGTAYANVMIL